MVGLPLAAQHAEIVRVHMRSDHRPAKPRQIVPRIDRPHLGRRIDRTPAPDDGDLHIVEPHPAGHLLQAQDQLGGGGVLGHGGVEANRFPIERAVDAVLLPPALAFGAHRVKHHLDSVPRIWRLGDALGPNQGFHPNLRALECFEWEANVGTAVARAFAGRDLNGQRLRASMAGHQLHARGANSLPPLQGSGRVEVRLVEDLGSHRRGGKGESDHDGGEQTAVRAGQGIHGEAPNGKQQRQLRPR